MTIRQLPKNTPDPWQCCTCHTLQAPDETRVFITVYQQESMFHRVPVSKGPICAACDEARTESLRGDAIDRRIDARKERGR